MLVIPFERVTLIQLLFATVRMTEVLQIAFFEKGVHKLECDSLEPGTISAYSMASSPGS